MKKSAYILSLVLALLFSIQGLTRSGGAPASRNGSPASNGNTCATSGCHTGGGTVNTETISISTNIPASGYQANTNYTITVAANDGTRNLSRIGFQASVEDANGHTGSLSSNGSRTKMAGSYITHTSSGLSPTNGVNTWNFTWNSGSNPPANAKVYVAVNFSNGNFSTSGDVIALDSLSINQASAVASVPAQSFETSGGSWNFSISPVAYNTEGLADDFIGGSEDVWDSIQAFTGDIDTASEGIMFWGMQDLNNGNGGGAFGHTLDFDPVDVINYNNAAISFDYYTDGYDGTDSLAYVAEFDTLSTWGAKTLLQKNSDAWVNVSVPIPAGSSHARLRIYAVQNGGSDFAGIDNVTIDTNFLAPVPPSIPQYSIASVTTNDTNGVADSLNVKCELRGTVFSIDFDGNTGYSFYIYDATGGINVFSFSDVSGYTVQAGDSLHVFGEIDQFNGLTEIIPDSIIVASTGNNLKSPAVVSTLDESTESEYIKLENFTLVNSSQWPMMGSSANVDITNGTDTLMMRIDSDTDIDGSTAPTDTFDVTGAGGQFSFATNLDDGYQILPSSLQDIDTTGQGGGGSAPSYPLYTIASVTTNDTNNVPDSTGVQCELRGRLHSIDFDGNNGYSMFMYDATGGINVFNFSDVNGYTAPARGDSIHVFGTIGQFRGLTQIQADSIVWISNSLNLRSPLRVNTLDETTESEFIELTNLTLANATQWPASGSSANVDVIKGSDTLTMRIDSDTDIDGSPVPTTSFDLIGAGGQFTFSASLDDGYQILPSELADFVFSTPSSPTVNFDRSSAVVSESAGSVTVTMSINPPLVNADTLLLTAFAGVGLTTSDGFTLPPLDTVTGFITIPLPSGADSASFLAAILDDAVIEGNETLFVDLFGSFSGNLQLGSLNTFDLVILDNDAVIPTYDIADVTTSDVDGLADSLGVECKLNGTVFTTDFRGGSGYQIYMSDGTGGINVFNFNDVSNYTNPRPGDSLRVIGTIIQFNGLTEIQPDSIIVLDTAQPLVTPILPPNLTESEEGERVRFNNMVVIDTNQWPAAGSSRNVDITNGVDTIVMRIDSDTDIDGTPAPTGVFDVIGVGSQFDNSFPFTEGYQLFPSFLSDLIIATPTPTPDLAITEVMPGSIASGSTDGDWFELRNHGSVAVNLLNFSWDDDSRSAGTHTISANVTINPGQSIIFLEAINPNDTTWIGEWKQRGNGLVVLNEDDQFSGFSGLSKGGDEVNFYDDQGQLISQVRWSGGDFTDGFALEYDLNGNLVGSAVDGVNGAYTSVQGDVGSPGDIVPVSLEEYLLSRLLLYPNPSRGILHIHMQGETLESLRILDLNGRVVLQRQVGRERAQLELSHLPKGLYLLELTTGETTLNQKVILR